MAVVTVRHVVVWQLRGDSVSEKTSRFEAVKPDLEALVGVIPGLQTLSVSFSTGPNPNNWDMCLISDHDSWEALEEYANHPAHVAVGSRVAEHTLARAGADFEI